MNVVEVKNLRKTFGETRAVVDVSFAVGQGEIFGLLGPNGAGKTTTIRMMMDIFKPDAGEVRVFGGTVDAAAKRRIGYLPEERGLYKDQKLENTLIYLATLKGLTATEAQQRLDGWLQRLDLHEQRHKKVQELSKGMQQKAQIIATLVHEPDLIVIDEPFSGLDPVNTRLVKQILLEQQEAGRTIIMSTHQMYQVEALCHRIVLIDAGRTVLYGLVDDIKRGYAGNAVLVEGQGAFDQVPGVLDIQRENGSFHLTLAAGTDPQTVFRSLAAREDTRIARFELAEPSLDDIFVAVVEEGRNNREAGHA